MRIATRMWLSISILLIGYFLTVAIGWWLSLSSEKLLDRVGGADFTASLLSQRANAAFIHQAQSYQDAVLQGEAYELTVARTVAAEVAQLLGSIGALELPGHRTAQAHALLDRHHAFSAEADRLYAPMVKDAAAAADLDRANSLYVETTALKAAFTALQESLSYDLRSELTSTIATSARHRRWMLSAFAVIASLSVGMSVYVAAQLTRRLGALVAASDRLSRGEFETVISDRNRDEIGALASSFDAMRLAVRARDLDLRSLNGSLEESVKSRTLELSLRNQDLTREVHERQRAEDSLRLLESAVTQTEDAVVIADASGIVFVNPSFTRMFGYSAEEIAGKPLAGVGGDAPSRKLIESLQQAATAGLSGFEELASAAKDGSRRMTEWRIGPIRERDASISHIVATVHDISARKRAEAELEEIHRQLLDASRQAGQAEVATGVLHNVGNVLNSINISATVVSDRVNGSKSSGLSKTVAMLESQGDQLPAFLATDEQRQRVLGYLRQLSRALEDERRAILAELQSLVKNVDHVKDVVSMQQAYARSSGFTMLVRPQELMEDALRMQDAAFSRHGVSVDRDYEDLPQISLDKHRTLQILINLVSNAKHALDAERPGVRRMWVSVRRGGPDRVVFSLRDNGDGIAAENLERIFSHGFTTREKGHGFGLHSSALAAQEMRGSLRAESPGVGKGATFTLELPV